MEDVLDVYQRPYDPMRPVVCFDECSKELRGTPRGSIEAAPGQVEHIDYEYERNGTANAFLWVEPLVGKRNTHITNTRTSVDCAEALKIIVDEDYPDAEKFVLVLDNLSTHTPAVLYERFEPAVNGGVKMYQLRRSENVPPAAMLSLYHLHSRIVSGGLQP